MKRISFLLPIISLKPAGGYKIVYEYANYLAKTGYEVDIVYPAYIYRYRMPIFMEYIRMVKSWIQSHRALRAYKTWYKLHQGVTEHFVWDLKEDNVPPADFYVATYVKTAVYLEKYKRIPAANKFYLIQGYENWGDVSTENLISTYHLNLRKIVVSTWLAKKVREQQETCTFIPNGFDFNYFKKTIEIKDKDRYCVTMMYHTHQPKGCDDGFKALSIVKSKIPQLHVNLFGVSERPANLPTWYDYYQQPDQTTHNKIYNEAALFLGTSWSEGWGLTIGEAMMCGCAIVCTDNLGYKEMVKDGDTALISPIKSPVQLADNIIKLMTDNTLREEMAARGFQHIQQFNWENSFKKFSELFKQEE